ncbi:MAG: hypothetical protein R2939_00300 [Kofleriaceae bacterium]
MRNATPISGHGDGAAAAQRDGAFSVGDPARRRRRRLLLPGLARTTLADLGGVSHLPP